ncbi:MAG: ABC transporter substrate-binding protein [Dermatophilaceae bacterium]
MITTRPARSASPRSSARPTHRRSLTRRHLLGGVGASTLAIAGCSSPSPPSAAGRQIKHASGTTEVPDRPARIVAVTGQMDLDTLLAVGVQPVAAGLNGGSDDRFVEYQQDLLGEEVDGFAFRPEPPLEAIAGFQPDLVLGHDGWLQDVYDQLRGIAPTVVQYNDDLKWEQNLRMVCDAVGKGPEAQRLLDDLDDRRAAARTAMADRAGTSVAFMTGDATEIFVSNDLTTTVNTMESVGLATPKPLVTGPDADPATEYQTTFSLETIDQLGDTDVWVVTDELWAAVGTNAVIRSLPVVRAGRVVTVDADEAAVWYYPTVLTFRSLLELLPQRIPAA